MKAINSDIISIVVPVYGCNATLVELESRIHAVFESIDYQYELLLVDDMYNESTWDVISKICSTNKKVKGLKLSRNFGQHYAITCGLTHCIGEFIVVMDCDLQDVPEEIPNLINKAKEGYEIVSAKRINRQDNFIKKLGSYAFYKVLSFLTDTKQDHTIANFGIYHAKAINAVLSMDDQIRYFPTMIQWVGFNKTTIEVKHGERTEGKSSYNFKKLLVLAFDNIVAFSDKPLRLTIKFGLLISLLTFIVGIYYTFLYLNNEIIQIGWTSTILSIWFLSGVIISILGIIGFYLGKTFDKVKDRPYYIIDKKLNI